LNGGAAEVDALKTQLATAKRELNKSINEKISLESKAKKEVDAVKSLLEDANYELDGLRRELDDGGSISRKEMEKKHKVWDGERAELAKKVQDLERTIGDGKAELVELRSAADEVDRLRDELDQARSRPPVSTSPDHSEELSRLSGEVTSLQAELVRARAQTSPSSSSAPFSSSADLTIRRLERKLDKAQRDAEALEESLNQAEEENQALRSRIPLLSSPGSKADDGRFMELEVENERLQDDVVQLGNQVHSLRRDLESLQASHAKALELEEALQLVQVVAQEKEAAWDTERKVCLSFAG
jgi:chromosome segregation ATPase